MTDGTRFEDVLRAHGALMRRIARSYEANGARADELTQDIYLAVWQGLKNYRGAASLRTFVARIAHNRSISHVAREVRAPRSVELSDGLPATSESPEQQAAQSDLRAKLETAVQKLPVNLKMVVTLALEGFSPDEIADVLGIGVSAASVRLHRAKAALQDLLRGPAS